MKTLPALAAVPASLQAVISVPTTTQLSVECDVFTAGGTANFSSLIAMPTSSGRKLVGLARMWFWRLAPSTATPGERKKLQMQAFSALSLRP